MAYQRIDWNDYDKNLSFAENVSKNAVATEALLDHMDAGIAKANNYSIGTVESSEDPAVEIEETEDGYKMNFKLPKGEAGEPGTPGEKGDPGENATIAIGTVATGDPGTNVSVSNTGTPTNAVLNFTIPKGDPGFSPTIKEDPNNTSDIYRLEIETETGSFITPNLKGSEPGELDVHFITENSPADPFVIRDAEPGMYIFDSQTIYVQGVSGEVETMNTLDSQLYIYQKWNDTLTADDKIGYYIKNDLGYCFIALDKNNPDINGGIVETTTEYSGNIMNTNKNANISALFTFTSYLPESSLIPTKDNQLVNKLYVDTLVANSIPTLHTLTIKTGEQEVVYNGKSDVVVEALKGDKGDSGTITIGNITTGEAGTQAYVTNRGTSTDAILDFIIPRGNPGTTIYSELTDIPQINGVDLVGNVGLEQLGIQPAGNYAVADSSKHLTLKSLNTDESIKVAITV